MLVGLIQRKAKHSEVTFFLFFKLKIPWGVHMNDTVAKLPNEMEIDFIPTY